MISRSPYSLRVIAYITVTTVSFPVKCACIDEYFIHEFSATSALCRFLSFVPPFLSPTCSCFAVVKTKLRHLLPQWQFVNWQSFYCTCLCSLPTVKACSECGRCSRNIFFFLVWLCHYPPRSVAATCHLSIRGQIRNRCSSLTGGITV